MQVGIMIKEGAKWWNNGQLNKRSVECPGDSFVLGRISYPRKPLTEETKEKIKKSNTGKVPWNKGIKNPNITGGKSPAAKKIYYDGTIYDCILNAIKITNKSYYHIKKYGTIVS